MLSDPWQLSPVARRNLGGVPGGKALDRADEGQQLRHVGKRERSDPASRVGTNGRRGHEAGMQQALEGDAKMGASDAQQSGDLGLDDWRAGRQAAGDDEIAQAIVGVGNEVATRDRRRALV